jgi:glycosyltransferase involved in cell wall biosynthesis
MASGALACVASSHFLVDWLKQFNPKVFHVPTGVDAEIFFPAANKNPQKPLSVLWNGIVWGQEILDNVVFALEVFEEVYKEFPNIRFLFVGGGQMMPELKKVISNRFSHIPVEIREWVHPNEMPDVLRESDIGLLPLIQNTEWIKGKSPTKLYEYLSSGLAVVASQIGEAEHIIENGKNGFLAKDKKEFIKLLKIICSNNDIRYNIGLSARKSVLENYALPVLGKKLKDMLNKLHLLDSIL